MKAQIEAASSGVGLAPQMILDQRAAFRYLNNIAGQIDKPAVDASLSLNGTEVVVTPGQIGRSLDVSIHAGAGHPAAANPERRRAGPVHA